MFTINPEDKTIHTTRGDIGLLKININKANGEAYTFSPSDIIRLRVMEKKNVNKTVLLKDITVTEATTSVEMTLTAEDTTIGESINAPVVYWYEMELNPDTAPQTFIGYDADGPKLFILYPEGGKS